MGLAITAVAAIAGGFLVLGLVGPLLAQRRLRRTRAPTADDRDRLAAVCPPAASPPSRVLLIETVGEQSIEVAIRGPPGYRTLFVTDHVLEELDTEVATALLTAELARTRLWYREYQVVAATIVIALGTSAMLLVVPFEFGFGGMLLAAAGLLAVGRRIQFRADELAAATVGAEPLADAFETVAKRHGADLSRGGWRRVLEVQPSIGDRIHRLRTAG